VLKCWFYEDDKYTRQLSGVAQGEEYPFVLGRGDGAAVLESMLTEITPTSWRRAKVREEMIRQLPGWAGKFKPESQVFMEFFVQPNSPSGSTKPGPGDH
jgi:hypothetical protein